MESKPEMLTPTTRGSSSSSSSSSSTTTSSSPRHERHHQHHHHRGHHRQQLAHATTSPPESESLSSSEDLGRLPSPIDAEYGIASVDDDDDDDDAVNRYMPRHRIGLVEAAPRPTLSQESSNTLNTNTPGMDHEGDDEYMEAFPGSSSDAESATDGDVQAQYEYEVGREHRPYGDMKRKEQEEQLKLQQQQQNLKKLQQQKHKQKKHHHQMTTANEISPFSVQASQYIQKHDYEQAIHCFQQALQEYYSSASVNHQKRSTQILHVDHPFGHLVNLVQVCNAAATSFNLGALSKKTKQYDEAVEYLYQAESLYRHCKSLLIDDVKQGGVRDDGRTSTTVCLDQLLVETLHMSAQIHLRYRKDLENAVDCHQQVVQLLLPLEDVDRGPLVHNYEHIQFVGLDDDDTRRQSWLATSWEQLGKCHHEQVLALPAMDMDDCLVEEHNLDDSDHSPRAPPPEEYRQILQNSTDAFEQAAVSFRWMVDNSTEEADIESYRNSLVSVLQRVSKMHVLMSTLAPDDDELSAESGDEQCAEAKQNHLDRSAFVLQEAVELVYARDRSEVKPVVADEAGPVDDVGDSIPTTTNNAFATPARDQQTSSILRDLSGFVPIPSRSRSQSYESDGVDASPAIVTPDRQNSGLLGEDLVVTSKANLPRPSSDAVRLLFNLIQLGVIYEETEQWDQATQLYERVLLVQSNYYGSSHPIVAQSLIRVGRVLTYQGNPEGGLDLFEAAQDIYHRHLRRNKVHGAATPEELEELPKVILAQLALVQSMAQLYTATKQPEEAVVQLTECLDDIVDDKAIYLDLIDDSSSIDAERLSLTIDRHVARMYRELGRAYVEQRQFIEANHCLISSVRILDHLSEQYEVEGSDDEDGAVFEDADRIQARALMQRIELLQRIEPSGQVMMSRSGSGDDVDNMDADDDVDEKKIEDPESSTFDQIQPSALSTIYSEEENELELELIYSRQRQSPIQETENSSISSDNSELNITHPTLDTTSGHIDGQTGLDERIPNLQVSDDKIVRSAPSPVGIHSGSPVPPFPSFRGLPPSPVNTDFQMDAAQALSPRFESTGASEATSPSDLSSNYFRSSVAEDSATNEPATILGNLATTSDGGGDSASELAEFSSAFPFGTTSGPTEGESDDGLKSAAEVSRFIYAESSETITAVEDQDEVKPLHDSFEKESSVDDAQKPSSFRTSMSHRSPSNTPSPDLSESSRTGLLQRSNGSLSVTTPKVLRMPNLSSPRKKDSHSKKDKKEPSPRNRFVKAISSPFRRVKKPHALSLNSFDEDDKDKPRASPLAKVEPIVVPVNFPRSSPDVSTETPTLEVSRELPAVVSAASLQVSEGKEVTNVAPPPPSPPKPVAPVDLVATQCDDSVSQLTLPLEENRFLPRESSEKKKEGQWWWGVNTDGLEGWFPSKVVTQAVEAAEGFLSAKSIHAQVQTRPLDFDSDEETDLDNNTLLGDLQNRESLYSKPASPASSGTEGVTLKPDIPEGASDGVEAAIVGQVAHVLDISEATEGQNEVVIVSEQAHADKTPSLKSTASASASASAGTSAHGSASERQRSLKAAVSEDIAELERKLKVREAESGLSDGKSIIMLLRLSEMYAKGKDVGSAISRMKQALNVQKSLKKTSDASVTAQHLAELHITQKQYQQALAMYTEAQQLSEAHYGYYHEEVASVLNACGEFLARQGKFDLAMERHQEALGILRRCFGEEVKHPLVSQTLIQIGAVYYKERNSLSTIRSSVDGYSTFIEGGMLEIIGRAHEDRGSYRMAIAFFEEKLQFLDSTDESDDLEHVAETLNSLGMLSCRAGLYMEAIDYYDKALGIQMKLGCHDVQLAMARVLTGSVQLYLGLFRNSLKLFQDALAILREEVGEQHETVAATLYQIGVVRASLCDYDMAMTSLHEALTIQRSILGNEHPATLRTRREIGNMYTLYVSELPSAFEEFNSVLESQKKIHGEKHPNVAETLHSLGCAHARKGDFDGAVKLFEDCYNMRLNFLGADHPVQATTLHEIGKIHLRRGANVKALHICDAALKIRMESLSEQHVDVAVSMATKASCLVAGGNFTEAARLFDEALPMAEEAVGPNHPTVASIQVQLGIMHQRKCHFDEARYSIEEALGIYHKANLDDDYPGIKEAQDNLESIERAEMLCV